MSLPAIRRGVTSNDVSVGVKNVRHFEPNETFGTSRYLATTLTCLSFCPWSSNSVMVVLAGTT
jgi:hypothetical protein